MKINQVSIYTIFHAFEKVLNSLRLGILVVHSVMEVIIEGTLQLHNVGEILNRP